jgi:glucose/arabinose dehydrogenase
MELPEPDLNHDARRYSRVVGWGDQTPRVPEGFEVVKFSDKLKNPRRIYQLPNGDILVVEAESLFKDKDDKKESFQNGKVGSQNMGNSANRITLFRGFKKSGLPKKQMTLLKGIKQPYGITYAKNHLYVAGTEGVWKFPYKLGESKLKLESGKKILNLPAGGYNNHWTRNLLLSPDETHIYVAVGSASNVGEYGMKEEERRANILKIDLNGKNESVYASGLRNPVGMDFSSTNKLWTVVNERDMIGDELVPDYMAQPTEGEFYGWPYVYFGSHRDPRMYNKRPKNMKKASVPEVALGAHTASLGLGFYDKKVFPKRYHGGAFIGQHGSWNRSELVGYQVAFIPFKKGKPFGEPEVFMDGFIKDKEASTVYGRPVGVEVLQDGSLLVADDASNTLWLVRKK